MASRCNSKDNYYESEGIAKIINDYENVTVYYDPNHVNIINIDDIKKRCKHTKFEEKNIVVATYVED